MSGAQQQRSAAVPRPTSAYGTTRLNKAKKNRSKFAWTSSPSYDSDHFVREIFYFISRRKLWFRCTVVNTHHADHKKYSGGDRDLSLEKYIFYHLLMFARREAELTKLTRFYIQLDNRTEKYTGAGLKASLNHRFRNETGHQWEIFADVKDVDSKAQVMVQAADVLAGCVAWVWNRQYENRVVDPHRIAFAKMIAAQAKLRLSDEARRDRIDPHCYKNFGYPTLPHHERVQGFTIWKMNFRKKQEDEAKAMLKRMRARYGDEATLDRVSQDYRIGATCFECTQAHLTGHCFTRNTERPAKV